MLDIDDFKHVNDVHGHTTGDEVLVRLAALIHREIRDEDVFARYGGDEFAVITPGVGLEGCRTLAERLRSKLEQLEIEVGETKVRVTLSAGCATSTDVPDATPGKLVNAADMRLYTAKRAGRNRVVAW
jgi:diguanylate cyclase (GGDEF)-like protein